MLLKFLRFDAALREKLDDRSRTRRRCTGCPTAQRQKALVTGANSGIGRAVAIALGQAGADGRMTLFPGFATG